MRSAVVGGETVEGLAIWLKPDPRREELAGDAGAAGHRNDRRPGGQGRRQAKIIILCSIVFSFEHQAS